MWIEKHRKDVVRTLALFLVVLAVPFIAEAAGTWLYSINGLSTPNRAAVGPEGSVVVTEAIWDRIKVLDPTGKVQKAVRMEDLGAVAVDAQGQIYIGSLPDAAAGEVKVYDRNLTYLRSLGAGAGEFEKPTDIAIGADGRIYIADSSANKIKIYNPDGTLAFAFGVKGTGDGYFNEPVTVAVDGSTGDIYVADRQLTQDTYGGTGMVGGARIQVYTQAGAFQRGFGSYTLGDLISPTDMELKNNILYVTDSYQNIVQTYNAQTGQALGILPASNSLRVPTSVALSPDGLMYIVSSKADQILVYGIDAYVQFDVSPKSLSFIAQEGGQAPAGQSVTITNNGTEQLSWTASSAESWLTMSPASGSAGTMQIGIAQQGLTAGQYTGKAEIRSQNGVAQSVAVSLELTAPAVLSVTPSALSFTADANGGNPPGQGIQVSLTGAIPGSAWTATTDAAWLTVNPVEAGAGDTAATVAVNTAGLAAGTYTGAIIVQAAGAIGSPATVSVSLSISNAGIIRVSTNLDSATFTIAGPQNYSGSGTTWTKTGAADGAYTITYGAVVGYKTPASETLSIANGGAIDFTGQYQDLREAGNIIASHGPGSKEPSDITIYRADGTAVMTIKPFPYTYGSSTAVGDVDGDGVQDIIAGAGVGPGSKSPAEIKAYHRDGAEIAGLDFLAFSTKFGVTVAAADFDGDAKDEIIAGQGKTSSGVKIFSYTNGTVQDTGVNITAYPGANLGVVVAAGDVDGDNVPELITGPEEADVIPIVNIYKIDTAAAPWSATLIGSISACPGAGGVNIAAGDTNADGIAEVLAVCGSLSGTMVMIYDGQAGLVNSFATGSTVRDYIAAGDTNRDGTAEVIVGAGPANRATTVQVFDAQGSRITNFPAFSHSYGIRVSIGNLGY